MIHIYIFMDNVPINAAKKIVELCAKANLWIIPITPYSLFLNPTEKLILFIKSKARKIQKSVKLITLDEIKRVIDSISPQTFSKWIRDSHVETYHLLNKLSQYFIEAEF